MNLRTKIDFADCVLLSLVCVLALSLVRVASASSESGLRVIFEDNFDKGSLASVWTGDRSAIVVEHGIATFRAGSSVPLNVELADWVLEFRARFSNDDSTDAQEWIRVVNAGAHSKYGKEGVGVNAHKRNLPFHYVLQGIASFVSPDIWGYANDGKFHDYKVQFINGEVSWYQDGVLIVQMTDLSAGSKLWEKLDIASDPQRPVEIDWIRLSAPLKQSGWSKRPSLEERQANWKKLTSEMWERIDAQIGKTDWENHPVYGARIIRSNDTIEIVRPVVRLRFSGSNCSISACRLRDVDFDGLVLPNLIVVDDSGRNYQQSYANDGRLQVRDQKEKAFVTGTFTPRSADGAEAPVEARVVYELRKVSGMLFVDYTITPKAGASPALRRCTVTAGLGSKSRNLNTYSVFPTWDVFEGTYQGYTHKDLSGDIAPGADRVVANLPTDYALWCDGKVGFQLYHSGGPYKQMPVSEAARSDANEMTFLTVEARNGEKFISMTPWNQGQEGSKLLDQPFKISLGLGLLPSREFKPKYATVWDRTFSLPFYVDHQAWSGRTEELIRRNAEQGVDMTTISLAMYSQAISQPTIYHRLVDTLHKYGMKVLYYTEGTGAPTRDVVDFGLMSNEEFEKALFTAPPDAPGVHANMAIGDLNSPQFRLILLATLYNCLKNFGVDGIYVDSFRPDAFPGGPSRLRGATDFAERARLLLDSFPERKYFLGHNWSFISPGLEGVTDFTYPGEQLMNANLKTLPPFEAKLGYNSFAVGAQVIPIDLRSYDLESMAVFHQFYSGCVGGIMNYHPWMKTDVESGNAGIYRDPKPWIRMDFTEQELVNAQKFFQPLSVFQAQGVHHPIHSDYKSYVSSCPDGVVAVVYDRPDAEQRLITVSRAMVDDASPGTVSVGLNLSKFPVRNPIVYDCVNHRLVEARSDHDSLTISNLSLDPAPQVLLVRETPESPSVVWHSRTVRAVESERYEKQELRVRVRGVPNCTATLWVYLPEGLSAAKIAAVGQGQIVEREADRQIVCLKFNLPAGGTSHVRLQLAK
ncbi:MAG: hypothetical protein HYX78_11710 [Armatimonadetes bacterium]|nr:hypothetical protein [Armatimonadota bacterium]